MSELLRRIEIKSVRTETGCMEWRGHLRNGYGRIGYRGRLHTVHRVAYLELVGPIPERHDLDHTCRNRACWEPTHLEPVTRGENIRRGLQGLELTGRCPTDLHDLSGEGAVVVIDGKRRCRECHLAGTRKVDRKRGLNTTGERCSVAPCPRPAAKRGWCNSHYERWRTTGDTGPVEFRRTSRPKLWTL